MYRFASVRHVVFAVVVAFACSAVPAAAQDSPSHLTAAIQLESVQLPLLTAPAFERRPFLPAETGSHKSFGESGSLEIFAEGGSLEALVEEPLAVAPKLVPRRPSALMPMYISFATLQVLDAHSTSRALDRGAVEANPVMRGLAGNTAGMLAVKAAATTGVVYSAERIWRKNKTAAVVFMLAANSAMAWVVQHNYRTVR